MLELVDSVCSWMFSGLMMYGFPVIVGLCTFGSIVVVPFLVVAPVRSKVPKYALVTAAIIVALPCSIIAWDAAFKFSKHNVEVREENQNNPWEHGPTFVSQFEILKMTPPKHVYVTVRDVKTGAVYRDIYVSKHCFSYQNGQYVGTKQNLLVRKAWRKNTPSVQELRFVALAEQLCG